MFYQNALKVPWRLSMVTCTLHDLSGEDVLDEEAAQVVSSVFSACFPRLFKHFCELWSKKMGMGARILAVPQHCRRRKCCRKPRLCPWHRCLSRSQRKHQWPGTTWDVQALWPEMQPMKTRYDTIANLHVYGYTVTQYQHRDPRQVCKSKTWAQRGRNRRENGTWADSACRMGSNQKITPDGHASSPLELDHGLHVSSS